MLFELSSRIEWASPSKHFKHPDLDLTSTLVSHLFEFEHNPEPSLPRVLSSSEVSWSKNLDPIRTRTTDLTSDLHDKRSGNCSSSPGQIPAGRANTNTSTASWQKKPQWGLYLMQKNESLSCLPANLYENIYLARRMRNNGLITELHFPQGGSRYCFFTPGDLSASLQVDIISLEVFLQIVYLAYEWDKRRRV